MQPTPILQRAIRRLALTTKQGPHNYYKGNRVGAMGRHTKWGGYVMDWKKVRTYVCPDLSEFNLTPFVAKRIEPRRDNFSHTETGSPMDPKEYIRKWKEEGGNM
ncbi:54S ribosomal protein L27, mitochondrial [Fulvia fulva]|uniref:54S ribosomal protein L27, mitochondrial n=1 Tax=Passalora fulva TaxID=5499 RepID=A0A9Q8P9K8_PASFU|nr:54S ribosomal protein L27, mitochondrial [Fulvia fulva]KAK4623753.1 54S ribosomal protein L27, mitochondrial [Fulvia fulva]KAK4625416.1 54S ribosomal protein L27, mitochondrial [Fulvia fulva]UJO18167.1 54S ribosomal protein L27, mitochondrial [Fulvia fulva]WPV15394.1 54S ribosomal protein L27, mitochondrial [Fulvia fulva]WPV29583.1 54S ribosomal protein L27, mitochondrial [Fulvia fulva]